jgi:hypothetical protein
MRGPTSKRRIKISTLSRFRYRRNSAYFGEDLVAQPLFWIGQPV